MEPVWLTVSSLKLPSADGVGLEGQELQLNWDEGVEEVALYTSDPAANSTLGINLLPKPVTSYGALI